MKYRKDVDGLRALAVIVVLLNHLDVAFFNGGYVGVDVFFVISGFVITGTLQKSLSNNTFSLIAFYERRIRRLLPGLIVTCLATTICAWYIFLPADFTSYCKSLAAACIGTSNFLFWRQAGYFDESAATKPLLHTWSLGVEEQFYLVFPFSFALLNRYGPKYVILLFSAASIASLGLSVNLSYTHPNAAFYLLPSRLWEMALGAILALAPTGDPRIGFAFRRSISILGMFLICISVLSYDSSTRFPGLAAIAPTFGTAFVIFAGGTTQPTIVNRLLATSPFVFIGRISYLIYLVHWPTITFVKYYTFDQVSPFAKTFVIVFSFASSIVIFLLIEQPIRNKRVFASAKSLFSVAIAFFVLTFSFAAAAIVTSGFPKRFEEQLAKHHYSVLEFSDNDNIMKMVIPYENGVPVDHGHVNPRETVSIGAEGPEDVIVWGDSHAVHLFDGINAKAAERMHKVRWFINYCSPPVLELSSRNIGGREYNQEVVTLIQNDRRIKHVIVAANWTMYLKGAPYMNVFGPMFEFQGQPVSARDASTVFENQLVQTVEKLQSTGAKVYLIGPIPDYSQSIQRLIDRCEILGRSPYDVIDASQDAFKLRHGAAIELLRSAANRTGVETIPLSEAFLADGRFFIEENGIGLYTDNHHLSSLGGRRAAEFIFQQIHFDQ